MLGRSPNASEYINSEGKIGMFTYKERVKQIMKQTHLSKSDVKECLGMNEAGVQRLTDSGLEITGYEHGDIDEGYVDVHVPGHGVVCSNYYYRD